MQDMRLLDRIYQMSPLSHLAMLKETSKKYLKETLNRTLTPHTPKLHMHRQIHMESSLNEKRYFNF